MTPKKMLLPILASVLTQVAGAAELHPSRAYSPEFSTVLTLWNEMVNPSVRNSVVIYEGNDFNAKGRRCFVMVHRSADAAHPVHSAIIQATQKIQISSKEQSEDRITIKAQKKGWQEFMGGSDVGEAVLLPTLFVRPRDLKTDGSFSGTWKYEVGGKMEEISGSESLDIDSETKIKTLSLFKNEQTRQRTRVCTFRFSSETSALFEASCATQSQKYVLYDTATGNIAFDKSLSGAEGANEAAIESSSDCVDLHDPRRPTSGQSLPEIHAQGTPIR